MPSKSSTQNEISSFAAPAEADIAVFEALPDDERRALIEAELEKGLTGGASRLTAEDIFARVKARLVRG